MVESVSNSNGPVRDDVESYFASARSSIVKAFYTTKTNGMGLPFSRAIIEAHGGQLLADSEHGPGARFFFLLAAERGAEP